MFSMSHPRTLLVTLDSRLLRFHALWKACVFSENIIYFSTLKVSFLFHSAEYSSHAVDLVLSILTHWNSVTVVRRWERKKWRRATSVKWNVWKAPIVSSFSALTICIAFSSTSGIGREKGITPATPSIYSPLRQTCLTHAPRLSFSKQKLVGGEKQRKHFPHKDVLVLEDGSLLRCQ